MTEKSTASSAAGILDPLTLNPAEPADPSMPPLTKSTSNVSCVTIHSMILKDVIKEVIPLEQ